MIKKVVDKLKMQAIKKFPEFDMEKLYVVEVPDRLYKITMNNNKFQMVALTKGASACTLYDTFKELLKVRFNNNNKVFILNDEQDLARFILGCREFPKVEEIEELVGNVLNEDEVSIDKVDSYTHDYAFLNGGHINLLILSHGNDRGYEFTSIFGTDIWSSSGIFNTAKEAINSAIKNRYTVYEFSDRGEDFFRWALEQITCKKFKNVEIKGTTLGGCMVVDYTNKITGIESFQ